MYDAPFATLTNIKARLKIADTTDDTVLTEMLLGVSAAIEQGAGRPLRRAHATRERFTGGRDSVRVRHRPVAKVHWVRESYDRNFDDAAAYTELEEGVDWMLDPVDGTAPGQLGWIRRLNGSFIGNPRSPGMVEVCYTGGYKTDGEAALENAAITFDGTTNTSLIDAFSIANRYMSGVSEGYLARFLAAATAKAGVEFSSPVDLVNRLFVTFQTGTVLIPTWEIVEATLVIFTNREDGASSTSVDGYILQPNVRRMLDQLQTAYELLDDPEFQIVSAISRSSSTFNIATMAIHSDAAFNCGQNMKELNDSLREGGITFGFRNTSEVLGTSLAMGIETETDSTTGERPSLVLLCRDTIFDLWNTPEDLRHACLLQTAHDWQVRKAPGFRQETQRGVAISSGVSYTRDPVDLLPEVIRIAQRYSWG